VKRRQGSRTREQESEFMRDYMAKVQRMATEGHQPSIDWLEHQEAKGQLRGFAEFIKRGPTEAP
jgi:hypothetical protein